MGLKEYARKRDFSKTPEPGPEEPKAKAGTRGGFFCVQRHDATHLHYDFRLQVGGVLASWAVPKGPSLDPKRKSLAMKVEDHPLDYGTFEGNIPKGEYGGGSVMLWDKGSYDVLGDATAEEQIERGDFKFELHGGKLNGSFAIVQMKRAKKGNEWLLIKKQDEYANPEYDIDQQAWSIATRRTQDEIANETQPLRIQDVKGIKKAALPAALDPMLAALATEPPGGDRWLYEIKWDGVRALCRIDKGELQIHSRRGLRCEKQYPEFASLPEMVGAKSMWLDGEICVLDEHGRARFHLIQQRIGANPIAIPTLTETAPAILFLFDVLYADGYDLRGAVLTDRKQLLETLVTPGGNVRISEAFATSGVQMLEAARQMGLEGIVAKDRNSTYQGTRSSNWQKIKIVNEQEFVIAGFTKGERDYFGALVLGVFDNGVLRHAGQVGTGFDQKMMLAISQRLAPLVSKTSPFQKKPKLKDVTWLRPETVAQIRFAEWTPEGMLRAPVFVALREDKPAAEVVQETPIKVVQEEASVKDGQKERPEAQHLELSGKEVSTEVNGHRLKFTNLDKVLFPKDGWKKRDLLRFYDRVAPYLLPHLKDRPLSLKRYPNGIHQEFFFQKNAGAHFPDWLHCHPITEHHPPKINHYPLADDVASLLYLVNLGCIDQNPWMSRIEQLDHPDWMLLDLDPVETTFDQLVEAALLVKEILGDLKMRGYPKTTGGDGMHVYVPLEPIYTYEQVRSFAELISHLALDRRPNLFTTPRSVNKRQKGRVYFDYLQIGMGKTIAAPYVVRAYDGAAVATPLDWSEVKPGLRPTDFHLGNAAERFDEVGDIFAPVLKGGQRLEAALAAMEESKEPPPQTTEKEPARKRTSTRASR